MVGDLVVAAPVVVLGPGVELPVGDGEVCPWGFLTKMGPESRSQTRSVGQWWKWRRARLAPARRRMVGGAAFGGEVVDEDVDVFDAGEVADDFGVDPGDGLEFAGPVLGVVGPGDPGGGVWGPLGGHAVVLMGGCLRHIPLSVAGFCCRLFAADERTERYFSLKTR